MLKFASTFYLPTLNVDASVREFSDVPLTVPLVTPTQIKEVTEHLRHHAAPRLQDYSHEDIIGALVETARLWLSEDSFYMATALEFLPDITGYSRPVVEYYLRHLLSQLNVDGLNRLIDQTPLATHHTPSRLVTHFCAGNIPGLAIEAIIFSLLARAPAFIKVSSDEPLLAALFARSLEEINPDIAKCLAAAWWPGGSVELDVAACELADVVVATGDDVTIEALRKVTPPGARFVAHPHKVSIGVVSKDFINTETAASIAKDVALFDQQGCLSPQVVFIESPDASAAQSFALMVHRALEEVAGQFPTGRLPTGELTHLQQVCSALDIAGIKTWKTSTIPFRIVALDEGRSATWQPLSLRGGVILHPVASLARVPELLHPLADRLQAIGVAVTDAELALLKPMLYTLRVSRLCQLGEMQTPPLGWHADQINPIECLQLQDHGFVE